MRVSVTESERLNKVRWAGNARDVAAYGKVLQNKNKI
jgi:hypothetical protein